MRKNKKNEDDTILPTGVMNSPGGLFLVFDNTDLDSVNADSINTGVGICTGTVLARPVKPSSPISELHTHLGMISRLVNQPDLNSIDDVSVDTGVVIRCFPGCICHPREPLATPQVYPVLQISNRRLRANRIGFQDNGGPFSLIQLKVIQECISLGVFAVIANILFQGQNLHWNHILAFLLIICAVYLVFMK